MYIHVHHSFFSNMSLRRQLYQMICKLRWSFPGSWQSMASRSCSIRAFYCKKKLNHNFCSGQTHAHSFTSWQLCTRALELKSQSGIIPFVFLANASIQFLYNYSASRSHSNSIPRHSNSIPVNPEVYRIPYEVAQFLTLSSGKSSYNTSLSVSHQQFNCIS